MTSFMKKALIGGIALSALLGGITMAQADETNPNIVHRQAMFKTLAGNLTALKAILLLGHEAKGDANDHAMAIKNTLVRLGNDFPTTSAKGETRALPAIWENSAKFKEVYENALMKADALVAATQGNDMAASVAAFKGMAGACKACHDDFRKKD